jgi:hypothetical protein
LQFFFPVTTFSKLHFFEVGVVVLVGGKGRSLDEDSFLDNCFLGIPGNCSQENGTPEYVRGVAGLSGESSAKLEDLKEEEDGESDDEEEKEGVP